MLNPLNPNTPRFEISPGKVARRMEEAKTVEDAYQIGADAFQNLQMDGNPKNLQQAAAAVTAQVDGVNSKERQAQGGSYVENATYDKEFLMVMMHSAMETLALPSCGQGPLGIVLSRIGQAQFKDAERFSGDRPDNVRLQRSEQLQIAGRELLDSLTTEAAKNYFPDAETSREVGIANVALVHTSDTGSDHVQSNNQQILQAFDDILHPKAPPAPPTPAYTPPREVFQQDVIAYRPVYRQEVRSSG